MDKSTEVLYFLKDYLSCLILKVRRNWL